MEIIPSSSYIKLNTLDDKCISKSTPVREVSYIIKKKLGGGSFGSVYLASIAHTNIIDSLLDNKLYALKFISLDGRERMNSNLIGGERECDATKRKIDKITNNFEVASRFYSRAETHDMQRYLVKYHHLLSYDNGRAMVIVMDYVLGKNLSRFFNESSLSALEICSIYKKMLVLLTFMHSQQFVHRDIKLENIIYHRDINSVTLIDYDFITYIPESQAIRENTKIRTVGTPLYFSPELSLQIIENKRYLPLSDVWALGVTIYQLFACREPYIKARSLEDIEDIIIGNKDPLSLKNLRDEIDMYKDNKLHHVYSFIIILLEKSLLVQNTRKPWIGRATARDLLECF